MLEILNSVHDDNNLNDLKQIVADLQKEIENYPAPDRDLLMAMVMAEEAAQEGESSFSSELMNKEELLEDLELAGGMDAIIEAFSIEAALSFHRKRVREGGKIEEKMEAKSEEKLNFCILL